VASFDFSRDSASVTDSTLEPNSAKRSVNAMAGRRISSSCFGATKTGVPSWSSDIHSAPSGETKASTNVFAVAASRTSEASSTVGTTASSGQSKTLPISGPMPRPRSFQARPFSVSRFSNGKSPGTKPFHTCIPGPGVSESNPAA